MYTYAKLLGEKSELYSFLTNVQEWQKINLYIYIKKGGGRSDMNAYISNQDNCPQVENNIWIFNFFEREFIKNIVKAGG